MHRRQGFGESDRAATSGAPRRSAVIASLPTQVHGVLPAEPGVVFVVRRRDLHHVPPGLTLADYRRLVVLRLCPTFAATGACPSGPACALAHAPIRATTRRFHPHLLPARLDMSSPAFVASGMRLSAYSEPPRFAQRHPGELFAVATPDGASHTRVAPGDCYITRVDFNSGTGTASGVPQTTTPAGRSFGDDDDDNDKPDTPPGRTVEPPLSHCAHWLQKGMCHFGDACRFVHLANPPQTLFDHVDASARVPPRGFFAPAQAGLLRSRPLVSLHAGPATPSGEYPRGGTPDGESPAGQVPDSGSMNPFAQPRPRDSPARGRGSVTPIMPTPTGGQQLGQSSSSVSGASGSGSRSYPFLHRPYDASRRE